MHIKSGMSKIDVILTQSLIKEDLVLKDKNVVIIDVLRATSTMVVALSNGAKEIVPADNPTHAARIARGSGNSLTCGERNGKIIEGFILGNSPYEYSKEAIEGKSLIFSTTNGTVSILKSKLAKTCVLASFLNMTKIIDHIKSLCEDVILLCSGKLNNFCIEDSVYAGVVINELQKSGAEWSINDSGFASLKLAKSLALSFGKPVQEKILDMYKLSEHGKYLLSIGFHKDLKLCSEVDSYPSLPVYYKSSLKLKEKIDIETTEKAHLKKINLNI
ncbi:2-phosphosulfolactate phosphatase [bacterium]|nr:MAG: 2-phosphosulfolactate phosphatase [bacterium]